MRLKLSGLWKKIQDEMEKDKTYAKKKQNNYIGSQLKISRFKTYFNKFKVPYNDIGFSNRVNDLLHLLIWM